VTFFSNPKNFRHPEPMRLWPEPTNYLFFNFCPSQIGAWEMKPGEDHVFRYRWYVHEGKPEVAEIERIWNDYANPPQVTVEAARPAKAIVLFDGKDFSQWQRDGKGEIGWKIADGAMQAVPKTGSIMTKRDFMDFILHAEFKTPVMPANVKGQGRGNSGIYIQRLRAANPRFVRPGAEEQRGRQHLHVQGPRHQRQQEAGRVAKLRHSLPRSALGGQRRQACEDAERPDHGLPEWRPDPRQRRRAA
jgi:hypothetical protein